MLQQKEYAEKLKKSRNLVINHLLPNGFSEIGKYFHNEITIDLRTCIFVDEATGDSGDLFDLWGHVSGKQGDELLYDIDHFLLNQESPPGMQRFWFTPDDIRSPENLYGENIEVFPKVKLYAGTTTLLAGYNGSGKSTLSLQVGHIMSQYGYKTFVLSPEMPPRITAHILARQSTNVGNMTDAEATRAAKHVHDNFLISTTQDRITSYKAIQQMNYGYSAGCRLIILDSLTCIKTGHELHQQADFSDELRNWSRSHPDAFLLVLAHMRKPSGYTNGMVSRYDIRGAGEISDLAGHIWLMSRKNPFSQQDKAHYGDFDAKLVVDKNRATGDLSCKMLKFDKCSKLYYVGNRPARYIDYFSEGENVERIY